MRPITKLDRDHLNHLFRAHMHKNGFLQLRRQEIENDVRNIGADSYDILLPETHILPLVTLPDEQLLGIVYGRYKQGQKNLIGRGALVATNKRVILVDKKPLFLKCDEIDYFAITGISYARVGPMGTVVLHTKLGDIRLRTFNNACAQHFVKVIEERFLSKGPGQFPSLELPQPMMQKSSTFNQRV